jgi:membrane-associated phospholipid phosphatase
LTLILCFWLFLSPNHGGAQRDADTSGTTSSQVSSTIPEKNQIAAVTAERTRGAQSRPIVDLPQKKTLFTPAEMIGGGLAITYGLFETDDEVYETLHGIRMRSSVLSSVSPVVSTMGLGTFSIALFGGFYAYHFISGDERSLQAANLGMETFLFSGIATQILKNSFGRERPSMATREGGQWSGPLSYFEHRDRGSKSIASYDAFPSGHTATIFAAAASIADSYPEKWVSYAAYGTATLVGISRVMESAHWPSDVFVGAIIGIGSTKIVENLPFNKSRAKVQLGIVNNSLGAELSFNF